MSDQTTAGCHWCDWCEMYHASMACYHPGRRKHVHQITALRETLRECVEALKWISTDLAYKAPEQVDPTISIRIIGRAEAALTLAHKVLGESHET